MELEQDSSDGSTAMEGITSAMLSPVKRAIPVQNISFLYEIKDGVALNARGENGVNDGCLAKGEGITAKISELQVEIESTTSVTPFRCSKHWATRTPGYRGRRFDS